MPSIIGGKHSADSIFVWGGQFLLPLDIRTLVFVAHLVAVCMAVIFLLVAKGNRISGSSMSIWGTALLARSLGFALIYLRPSIPLLLSLFVANALVLVSFQLICVGFLEFFGRPFRWGRQAALTAVILVFLGALFGTGSYDLFVSGITLPLIGFDLGVVLLLLRRISPGMGFFQRGLASLFGLETLLFACRLGWHLFGPTHRSLFTPSLMIVLVYLEVILSTVFFGTALLALVYQRAHLKKLELIAELEATLAKVHTLEGLLPMCAWCKKIRDEDGSWHSVETYVCEHTDAAITHGICPECKARFQS